MKTSVRFLGIAFTVSAPLAFGVLACESSASNPAVITTPDAQSPTDPQPTPDVPVADAAAPIDAADDADAADAAPVTSLPFSTGVGTDGSVLEDDQIDPHWTVKDSLGAVLTPYVKTDALGYAGYWLPPSETSKFISPFIDTIDPSGTGTFTYTTTFTLGDEVTLANVELEILYASDNQMTDITLNGTSQSDVAAGSFSAFTTRTVTAPFVRGTNTLSFTVANSGGPTGMRAEIHLTQ